MKENSSNNFRNLLLISIPTGAILFMPLIKIEIAPESKVRVVDCDEKAVSNILVTQVWKHLRYEQSLNIAEQKTDKNGFVVFPVRNINISVSTFLMGKLIDGKSMDHINKDKETHCSFGVESEASKFDFLQESLIKVTI